MFDMPKNEVEALSGVITIALKSMIPVGSVVSTGRGLKRFKIVGYDRTKQGAQKGRHRVVIQPTEGKVQQPLRIYVHQLIPLLRNPDKATTLLHGGQMEHGVRLLLGKQATQHESYLLGLFRVLASGSLVVR